MIDTVFKNSQNEKKCLYKGRGCSRWRENMVYSIFTSFPPTMLYLFQMIVVPTTTNPTLSLKGSPHQTPHTHTPSNTYWLCSYECESWELPMQSQENLTNCLKIPTLIYSPHKISVFLPFVISELCQKVLLLSECPIWSDRPVRIMWAASGPSQGYSLAGTFCKHI